MLLTTHGSEQQWQPSTGWSGILHRSGILYHPRNQKMHICNLFLITFLKKIWITDGVETIEKLQWQWVLIVHYLGYLKRNLPGPGPRHSSLPIYNLVVSAHLGLDNRHSTPWDPITQSKHDVLVPKYGTHCILYNSKFQNVFHVLLHEVFTILVMCKQWYLQLLLHYHKQLSHRYMHNLAVNHQSLTQCGSHKAKQLMSKNKAVLGCCSKAT